MNRQLTPEERKLWLDVMSGTARLRIPVTVPSTRPRMPAKRLVPWNPVLDLHNYTLQEAHAATLDHLSYAHQIGWRRITIITGRSGPIAEEFKHWIQGRPEIQKKQTKSGGGAWEIWLRKNT